MNGEPDSPIANQSDTEPFHAATGSVVRDFSDKIIQRVIVQTPDCGHLVCLVNQLINPVTEKEFSRRFHPSQCGHFSVCSWKMDKSGVILVTVWK